MCVCACVCLCKCINVFYFIFLLDIRTLSGEWQAPKDFVDDVIEKFTNWSIDLKIEKKLDKNEYLHLSELYELIHRKIEKKLDKNIFAFIGIYIYIYVYIY